MIFFIASGFSTATLVNREVNAPRHYKLTKLGEIASNLSRNESEKNTQFAGTRTHDLKLEGVLVEVHLRCEGPPQTEAEQRIFLKKHGASKGR